MLQIVSPMKYTCCKSAKYIVCNERPTKTNFLRDGEYRAKRGNYKLDNISQYVFNSVFEASFLISWSHFAVVKDLWKSEWAYVVWG